MGSIMDSAYWTCDFCCTQYEWKKDAAEIKNHDCEQKRKHAAFVQKNTPRWDRLTPVDQINADEKFVDPPKWHTFKGGKNVQS